MPHLQIDPETGLPLPADDTFRLEPLPRSNEVTTGLTARTHDAAWLLTRQWQFGEFAGQDAGSPVLVSLEGRSERISAWRPRPEAGEPLQPDPEPPRWVRYRPGDGPLDPQIEGEGRAEVDLRTRIEGGAQLVTMLRAAGHDDAVATLVGQLPVTVDEDLPVGPITLLAASVPDAREVARRQESLDVGGARPVLEEWMGWWKQQTGATSGGPARKADAYNEHRFEHRLELSCGDLVLRADEYLGDGLDWHSVDRVPGVPAPHAPTYRFRKEGLPTPVRYAGLPADRFWQMEDREIDLASADVKELDTGRLLLIGFAQVYGNDWFVVPLEVPTGSLTTIGTMQVTDSFGDVWPVPRAGSRESGWNLFAVTGTDEGLLVMPTSPGLPGPVMETVTLARDELANTAWAIEGTVRSPLGDPVDRRGAWQRAVAAAPPTASDPDRAPAYAVQTIVPDYWLPLVPQQTAPESLVFRLAELSQPRPGVVAGPSRPDPELVTSRPRGRLLTEGQWVHEEEVPREGAHLTRRPVVARWYDGSWHTWVRREKNAGAGESSSGLAFDLVRPSDPWP